MHHQLPADGAPPQWACNWLDLPDVDRGLIYGSWVLNLVPLVLHTAVVFPFFFFLSLCLAP